MKGRYRTTVWSPDATTKACIDGTPVVRRACPPVSFAPSYADMLAIGLAQSWNDEQRTSALVNALRMVVERFLPLRSRGVA